MSQEQDDALLAAIAEAENDRPQNTKPKKKRKGGWKPDLNPTQQLIFDDPAENILGHGPKFTGKSIGFLHKMVRHCYENDNTLAFLISPSARTGAAGVGYDLTNLILPAWRDGNRDKEGNLIDEGLGIQFTEWRQDPQTKDHHLWIETANGAWSLVLMISIPYAKFVAKRIKGPAPSFVYVDELTDCEGREYYTYTKAQVGRRRGIKGPQQWCASCNPKDPENWVYKLFWEECVVDSGGRVWPDDSEKPGIQRHKSFSVYRVPFSENERWLQGDYLEQLKVNLKSDAILYQRLIDGKWLAYPSGDALFKQHYSDANHLRGDKDPLIMRGLVPLKGYPIVVGYDLGKVHSGIVIMQCFETSIGPLWVIFDELCYYGERIPYYRVTTSLLAKLAYWNRRMEYHFEHKHISDDSAFNQFNASKGSTDVRDIEQYSKQIIELNPSLYEGIKPIRLTACPKSPGSVEDRVNITMDTLMEQRLVVSVFCPWVRRMFLHLEHEDGAPLQPKRGRYVHTFDGMSYPFLYRRLKATQGFKESGDTSAVSVSTS